MSELQDRILTQCFKLSNLRTLREKARDKCKKDEAEVYQAHIDFEVLELKKMCDEMDEDL